MHTLAIQTATAPGSQPFQDIFGHYAGYVAATMITIVTVLIVWAFLRGQPVELGPVKIGRRRRRIPRRVPRNKAGTRRPAALLSPRAEDTGKVYDVSDVAQFYAAIAVNYDQGNSVNLLATHRLSLTFAAGFRSPCHRPSWVSRRSFRRTRSPRGR